LIVEKVEEIEVMRILVLVFGLFLGIMGLVKFDYLVTFLGFGLVIIMALTYYLKEEIRKNE